MEVLVYGAARRRAAWVIIRKYAFELALALAVIYVYAPLSLEYVAKLRWLDDINVIVNNPSHPQSRKRGVSLSTQSP